MEPLELTLMTGAAIAGLAVLSRRLMRAGESAVLPVKLLVAVGPGILGAVVILAPRMDLIPDTLDPARLRFGHLLPTALVGAAACLLGRRLVGRREGSKGSPR